MTETPEGRSRRTWIIGGAIAGVLVIAALAFGVFGVQTLFFDREVDEAGPTFASGATAEPSDEAPGDDAATTTSEPSAGTTTTPPPVTTAVPEVRELGRGTFEPDNHPGAGTAVVLSDGRQAFVRFEDDFSTDNGPDLYAVAYVGGQRVELGVLKGNKGAQNYEVPPTVDPADIEAVAVWCKRFDSTFTTAPLR